MQIGSLVAPTVGDPLHCGSGLYDSAVVISIQPFVLISQSGDMRWVTRKREDFQVVGTASPKAAKNVLERIDRDAEAASVVNDDSRRILRQLAKG